MTKTRILGIDPGLNITGYGVLAIDGPDVVMVEAGVVRSVSTKDIGKRLKSLHQGITEVIESLAPDCIGLEELYSHYERPQTAIIMGHARGVICLAAAQSKLPVCHYAATQVKKILTGNGRAPKNQVQLAVTRHLNLPETPEPPDVADALAIALCHYYLDIKPTLLR
jgi:crossover junction endodeoxyribonuclease RuvC